MTSPTSTPPPFTTTGSTLSTDKPVGDLPTAHYLGWERHTHTSAGVCAAPIYRGCRCTARRCLPAPPCGSPKTEGGRNSSRMASWAPPRQKATRRPTGPGRSELREAFIFLNTGVKPSRTAEKATTPRVREMTLSSGKKKKKKTCSTPLPVVGRGLVYSLSWAFYGTMEYLLGDRFWDGDTWSKRSKTVPGCFLILSTFSSKESKALWELCI